MRTQHIANNDPDEMVEIPLYKNLSDKNSYIGTVRIKKYAADHIAAVAFGTGLSPMLHVELYSSLSPLIIAAGIGWNPSQSDRAVVDKAN